MNSNTHEQPEHAMAEHDEKQWERHLRDEAGVIQGQQETAGTSHRPVAGPGLYGDHATNIYVRGAVQAERDRCVRVAQLCVAEPALREKIGAVSERDREVARAVANAIVAAIRSDDQPE